jgi:mono/diheme cytochrome c family protein/peroxiredoxin
MTGNDECHASAPIKKPGARRGRGLAKLVGANVFMLASLAWLCHVLLGLRDEWPSWTVAEAKRHEGTVPSSDDRPLLRGREIYQSRCVRCHGDFGHGDGPAFAQSGVRLTDLGSASWRTEAVRDVVRCVVEEGIPEKAMPGAAGELSARELDSVVDYVLSLEITDLLHRAGFHPEPGRIAAPLVYRDVHGTVGSLERLRGKVVLIAFWGTTCAPCLAELPELQRLSGLYKKTDFVVLPVCVDNTNADKARDVSARLAPNLPVCFDHDGSAGESYGVRHLPQIVLVDRTGRVLGNFYAYLGAVGDDMERLLSACLRMPPADTTKNDDAY